MTWFTYILYSQKLDKYYVGFTHDLSLRLQRHNSGWGKFTHAGIPWKLVYFEEFTTKSDAIKREREIKRKKSRKYIEKLITTSLAEGRPDKVGKSRRPR